MTPAELLEALWGDGYHALCAKRDGGRFHTVDVFSDPGNLLVAASRLDGCDVWFSLHALGVVPASGRGRAEDVASVVALGADLDWLHVAHGNGILPSEGEVRERLSRLGELAPSVVVNTGHGLQPYWLLDSDVGPKRGAELQARLDAHLASYGLHNERSDLASVLRLPGTLNHKGDPVPVVIEHGDADRRFVRQFLERRLPKATPRGARAGGRQLDERDTEAVNLLLEHFGGHSPVTTRTHVEVTRPGKPQDCSATVGAIGPGTTKVWSTNWDGLPADVYGLSELRRLAGVEGPRFRVRDAKRRLRLRKGDTHEMRAVEWLWTDRAALGSLVLCAGREGVGKGVLASWLAAKVTNGTVLGALEGQPRSVLWIGTEDSLHTTIVPRWTAAGADLDRMHTLALADGSDASEQASEYLEEVVELIAEAQVGFVVLDPFIATVPLRLDAWKEQHARAALLPWRNLAEQTGATVFGLTHFGKGHGHDALTAILNSRAFTAAARGVLVVGFDPEEDPPSTRVVVVRKSNLGRLDVPGFAYTVEGRFVGNDAKGLPIMTGVLVERGERPTPPSAESMMHPGEQTPPSKLEEARQFLDDMLHDGEQLATEVEKQAAAEGIAPMTLRRAKADRGVIVRREGFGPKSRVYWSLPPIDDQKDHRSSHSKREHVWDSRAPMDEEPPSAFCSADGCGLTCTTDSAYCWRHQPPSEEEM